MPKKYTLVTINNYHELIPEYLKTENVTISNYEEMKNIVIKMISDGYCFNMDKNLLRGYIEDFVFMYNQSEENLARVS